MEEKFRQIKAEYDKFYRDFLKKGQLPMGDTEAGFWGTAATDDIMELFRKIHLEKFESFIDLGSGDGKVVLIASLFTKAAGIEFDKDLHAKAVEIREKVGISAERAELICGDFLKHDLSKYDIVFINPDKSFDRGLEEKLKKELKGILLVYNMVYAPDSMKKDKTYWLGETAQTPATVYTLK